ncbi:hypothetical protein BDZ89DRAFT_1098021 [Hymenopellis radicata]|nr:hypothetical protein BDZ89DRAFT_1098021 [Hymenopellis radicata]
MDDQQPQDKENEPVAPPKAIHPFSPDVLAPLFPSAMFGLLCRLGLEALATYDGQSIFVLAYPQAVGCLIMGFCRASITGYTPVLIALTTGFCGSVTTFSGWQLDIFESWLNPHNAPRGALRDVVDGITKSVFTVSISLASLLFGHYLASSFTLSVPHPPRVVRISIIVLSILIYAAAFPLYFRLSPSFRHQATSALLFSPPGALMRYALSVKLNIAGRIPWGTFIVNTFGTALLGIFHVVQRLNVNSDACTTLQGLSDGYCGCLTTISTFAVEITVLKGRKKWIYSVGSYVTAQLLLLVIIGPALLSGVRESNLCTFEH